MTDVAALQIAAGYAAGGPPKDRTMLVLTRQEGESLTIGDGIVVTVLKLRTGDVSIGVEAPREVSVVRTELLEGSGPESEAQTT